MSPSASARSMSPAAACAANVGKSEWSRFMFCASTRIFSKASCLEFPRGIPGPAREYRISCMTRTVSRSAINRGRSGSSGLTKLTALSRTATVSVMSRPSSWSYVARAIANTVRT